MAGRHFPSLPFPRLNALAKQRLYFAESSGSGTSNMPAPSPSLRNADTLINHIPGEPGTGLTKVIVYNFLCSELGTALLDELYDHLWLVARKCGRSIEPLNRQRVKAREVVATEDVRLHLVWYRNRIHIKPMPLCLLNYDFWATYLPLPAEDVTHNEGKSTSQHPGTQFDRRFVLGFMRSYALLVRHRVDFVIARESHLFPIDFEWEDWSKFIAHFRHIEDEDVAIRYHYGQLRLSRLNWAVRLFRPSFAATAWFYEIPHWSTGMYVERAMAPLVFGFASLSLAFSAIQVLLSMPEESLGFNGVGASSLIAMRRVFWVFSVMMLLVLGLVWILFFVIPAGGLLWQLLWGFKHWGKANTGVPVQRGQEATARA